MTGAEHDHHHDELHQHGQHQHGERHGGDFDWDAMADRLELDAAITAPIVDQLVSELRIDEVRHVLDVGCGPGVVAVQLATLLPGAQVTALDSNEPLLQRVVHNARAAGVGERVDTMTGDLDQPLPHLPAVDLVWAGMVLHHVVDAEATLAHLRDSLRAGGTLVMIEFGDTPTVLPSDDPLLVDGTWQRFQQATTTALNERLGLDPVTIDWAARLRAAGFSDITDRGLVARHPSPLTATPRSWLVPHILRGLEMVEGRLASADVEALQQLADDVPTRADLLVHAARRVLTAHRP